MTFNVNGKGLLDVFSMKNTKNTNGIMDRFFENVNPKVNFGRSLTPARPTITILKDIFLKYLPINK